MVVAQGQGSCVAEKAEPIGVPRESCPLWLNPALKSGERYLVSIEYLTRNQWWGDEVEGLPAGAFVQYWASNGMPKFPLAIWRFALTPSGGLPARALFVLNATGDGTMLSFRQQGFGHYLIDSACLEAAMNARSLMGTSVLVFTLVSFDSLLAKCIPDCAGKQCGDDGCGGECGECGEGFWCTDFFKCAYGYGCE